MFEKQKELETAFVRSGGLYSPLIPIRVTGLRHSDAS